MDSIYTPTRYTEKRLLYLRIVSSWVNLLIASASNFLLIKINYSICKETTWTEIKSYT